MLIDDDVHVRAKGDFGTADDARNLTDMIRGLISIAKLQAAREPSLVKLLETIRVDASGQSMIVSVDAPGDLIPIVR